MHADKHRKIRRPPIAGDVQRAVSKLFVTFRMLILIPTRGITRIVLDRPS